MRDVRLQDGCEVPAIGQGTWHMGESAARRQDEVAALRRGLELGMRLIDTAEMYADGGAERLVGEAISGRRDQAFLVSKAYPWHAGRHSLPRACEASLDRLGTDYLDLYLLHWRGDFPLMETVDAFERLREQGKIRRWGVSNFDVDDLQELEGLACATNQVQYNPEARGVDFDLLPWQRRRGMPLMAYCPVGQGGGLLGHPALLQVAERRGATPAQIALAWCLRDDGVIAIPKAVDPEHLRQNAEAADIRLDDEDRAVLDAAFPPPTRKQRLAIV